MGRVRYVSKASEHHGPHSAWGPGRSYESVRRRRSRLAKSLGDEGSDVLSVHDHGRNELLLKIAEHLDLPGPIR
jgi:hypothetical protein